MYRHLLDWKVKRFLPTNWRGLSLYLPHSRTYCISWGAFFPAVVVCPAKTTSSPGAHKTVTELHVSKTALTAQGTHLYRACDCVLQRRESQQISGKCPDLWRNPFFAFEGFYTFIQLNYILGHLSFSCSLGFLHGSRVNMHASSGRIFCKIAQCAQCVGVMLKVCFGLRLHLQAFFLFISNLVVIRYTFLYVTEGFVKEHTADRPALASR